MYSLSMEIFTENFTTEILEKNIVPLFIMFLASFIATFIMLELLSDQKFEGVEYDEELEEDEHDDEVEEIDEEMEENLPASSEDFAHEEEEEGGEVDEQEERVELLGLSRVNMEYVLRKYGGIGVTYEVAVEVDYDLFGGGKAPISRRLLEQFLEQQGAQRLSDSQWSQLVSIYPYYPEDEELEELEEDEEYEEDEEETEDEELEEDEEYEELEEETEDEEDERIPFACRARVNDRIVRHGTFDTTTHTFEFNNGLHAHSPSGACQVVLKRRGSTNKWQGPSHVYLFLNNKWVVFRETAYY